MLVTLMRNLSTMVWLTVVLGGAGACAVKDKLYCESDQDCVDNPGRPFCDVNGIWPESERIAKTCIASPFDAGVPDPIDAGIDAIVIDANKLDPAAGPWSTPVEILSGATYKCPAPKPSYANTELYLVNKTAGMGDVAYLSRGNPNQDWGYTPTSVAVVNTNAAEANPTPSPDGLELYLERGPDILVAKRSSPIETWGPPMPTGLQGSNVDILSDGLTMYYATSSVACPSLVTCRVRVTRLDTHSPWGHPTLEKLQTNDGYNYFMVDFSGDGLHALLSSVYDPAIPVVGIASRASLSEPWSTVTPLVGIAQTPGDSGQWDCASWSWSTRDVYMVSGTKLYWSHLGQ